MGLNELVLPDHSSAVYTVLYMPQLFLGLLGLLQMYKKLPISADSVKDWKLAASEYLKHHIHYYAGGFVLFYFHSWMMTRYLAFAEKNAAAKKTAQHSVALIESERIGQIQEREGGEERRVAHATKHEKREEVVEEENMAQAVEDNGGIFSFIFGMIKSLIFPFTFLAKLMKYFIFLWLCHLPFFYVNSQRFLPLFSTPAFNAVWYMALALFSYSFSNIRIGLYLFTWTVPNLAYWCLTIAGVWHWWTYMKYTKFELYDNVIVDTYHAVVHYILPGIVDLFWAKFGYYILIAKWTWPVAREAIYHYYDTMPAVTLPSISSFFPSSSATLNTTLSTDSRPSELPETLVIDATDPLTTSPNVTLVGEPAGFDPAFVAPNRSSIHDSGDAAVSFLSLNKAPRSSGDLHIS